MCEPATMPVQPNSAKQTMPSRHELNRLTALFNSGKLDQLLEAGSRLARKHPECGRIFVVLSAAHLKRKDYASAAANSGKALQIDPDDAAALSNHGIALKELGRLSEAIGALQRAVSLNPKFAPGHFNLGNALRENGLPEQAIAAFERTLMLRPDDALSHCNMGLALFDLERFEEAATAYRQAIHFSPDHVMAHANLGNALFSLGHFEQAVQCQHRALAMKPDYAMSHYNLGRALEEISQFDEAIAAYEKAVELDPTIYSAQFNLALLQLRCGDFKQGWQGYEWRKKKPGAATDEGWRSKRWSGVEDISGKAIFLYPEQGLGDTIQFIRYALLVRELGAKVCVGVQPGLRPMLSGALPDIEFIDPGKFPAGYEYHAALLSLPMVFGTTLDSVPAPQSYLRADPQRIAKWRDRLGPEGFKIGICWQGSTLKIDKGRSLPLSHFAGLSNLPGVRLISLHKGSGEDQLGSLPAGMNVETLGGDFDPPGAAFTDTAAVMQCCDLVITSDTAVAHLAGALGVPVWTVLRAMPDWRWMVDREDSPWYPAMRLFRQTQRGDWPGVFERVEESLKEMVSQSTDKPGKPMPHIPVSWGELLDKITILEIKSDRISAEGALKNVRKELTELNAVREADLPSTPQLVSLQDQLRAVNRELWDIEEDIRAKESAAEFDARFIALARAVYQTNDRRSALKRQINALTGSAMVEEKSY